jgi:hypothetical protein
MFCTIWTKCTRASRNWNPQVISAGLSGGRTQWIMIWTRTVLETLNLGPDGIVRIILAVLRYKVRLFYFHVYSVDGRQRYTASLMPQIPIPVSSYSSLTSRRTWTVGQNQMHLWINCKSWHTIQLIATLYLKRLLRGTCTTCFKVKNFYIFSSSPLND